MDAHIFAAVSAGTDMYTLSGPVMTGSAMMYGFMRRRKRKEVKASL